MARGRAVQQQRSSRNYFGRGPSGSGLVDVLDLILDKGLVIDAYVRVSLVGIELLTIDAVCQWCVAGAVVMCVLAGLSVVRFLRA